MAADDWINDTLDEIRRSGLWRQLRQVSSAPGVEIEMAEPVAAADAACASPDAGQAAPPRSATRHVLQFASNDYLALAADPRLAAAAASAAAQFGTGSTASRLIVGHQSLTARLEQSLAELKRTEGALVLSTGYMANLAAIGALVGPGDLILADRLCHASMIDGARLSGARLVSWRHNDAAALRRKLSAKSSYRRRLVVTESVFSMDGDLAPLGDLAELCETFGAMLLVDEAHATGVFGPRGGGLTEQLGLPPQAITATVGTLSKALGGQGGFVAGRRSLIDLIVNRGRPLVYSTGMPAMQAAVGLAALEIVQNEPERRHRVLHSADSLRCRLQEIGLDTGKSASPIIPVMLGDADRTMAVAAQLWAAGLYIPAIRPPTVPRGSSRLRVSLSAAHADDHIDRLVAALGRACGRN